jgi:hypothetical protein
MRQRDPRGRFGRRRFGPLLAGVLLIVASPAVAQDESRGEFSVGWRYYHATISSVVDPFRVASPNDYPQGWYADVAVNLSPVFAIVGEAGGSYHSDETSRTSGTSTTTESLEVMFHTFMGGVRIRAPHVAWFVPFGQVVFGGERDTSTSVNTFGTTTIRTEGGSSSPVLGLDAGTTVMAGWIGVRVSAGYVRFFNNADADTLRVNVGGAFRF